MSNLEITAGLLIVVRVGVIAVMSVEVIIAVAILLPRDSHGEMMIVELKVVGGAQAVRI